MKKIRIYDKLFRGFLRYLSVRRFTKGKETGDG